MDFITISGWGQQVDALASIAPTSHHQDYLQYPSDKDWFATLPPHCDILVGWSLGGQLAIQTVPLLSPKLLILLSTPACLASPQLDSFITAFATNPTQALARFQLQIAHGDSNASLIRKQPAYQGNTSHFASWLEQLKDFNASSVDFSGFPRTIIIHGTEDVIVPVAQAATLHAMIPGSKLITFEQCGHAPHLHNHSAITTIITNEIPHSA